MCEIFWTIFPDCGTTLLPDVNKTMFRRYISMIFLAKAQES